MLKSKPEQYEVVPLKLTSSLRRQLARCGQTKCRPQQWVGVIRNLVTKGVSAAEIEGSEIIVFLERQPPTLSMHIDELISFLDDLSMCELVLQRRVRHDYEPTIHYEELPVPVERPPKEIRHGRREFRFLRYTERSFGFCIWRHIDVDTGLFGQLRYWSFSVPHGRKHLPTFANEKQFETLAEAMSYGRRLAGRMAKHFENQGFVGPSRPINCFERYSLPLGDRYTEWLITAPNLPANYVGPHFDIRNLVAHIRTTERTVSDGKRLLVLEEIQSDWNQELRKAINKQKLREKNNPLLDDNASFLDDIPSLPMNPYLNHWLDASLRMMLLLSVHRGFSGIAWLPGRVHVERFPWANEEGLKEFYDRLVPKAVEKLVKPWGGSIGEAQFVTLSSRYEVRSSNTNEGWRIVDLASRQQCGGTHPTRTRAEILRQAMETHVQQIAPCALVSTAVRESIRRDGMPQLGAIRSQKDLIQFS